MRTHVPALLLALLVTVGCSSPGGGPDASDAPPGTDAPATDAPATDAPATDAPGAGCGSMTCGADQYCEDQCTCCGIPIPPDSGIMPSSVQTCRPIPSGCSAGDLCNCPALRGNGCDQRTRTVSIPCA